MNPGCYAVIAGIDFEGEVFDTLRLFDCKSSANAYAAHLDQDYDYVKVELRGICMESALLCAA